MMTIGQLKIARIPCANDPEGSELMAEVCDTALELYAENERLRRYEKAWKEARFALSEDFPRTIKDIEKVCDIESEREGK